MPEFDTSQVAHAERVTHIVETLAAGLQPEQTRLTPDQLDTLAGSVWTEMRETDAVFDIPEEETQVRFTAWFQQNQEGMVPEVTYHVMRDRPVPTRVPVRHINRNHWQ